MDICKKLEEDISAYVDGELTPQDEERVTEHLQICPACQQKVNEWKAVWDCLDTYTLQPVSVSTSITQFYSRTLPSFLIQSKYRSRWKPVAGVLAASFLGIIFGLWIYTTFFAISYDEDEIVKDLEVLNNPNFELIAHLDLLESYEVFKYFSPEMLLKWTHKK